MNLKRQIARFVNYFPIFAHYFQKALSIRRICSCILPNLPGSFPSLSALPARPEIPSA